MRFLLLTQYFSPEVGAPQIRLLAFAQQLQAHSHKVTVVTAMPNYPAGLVQAGYRGRFMLKGEVDGVPVIRTWIYAATGTGLRRLASYLSFCLTSLFGCLRAPACDYILVESPPLFLGGTAFVAGLFKRAPFVMIVSDLWPESARELGMIRGGALLWLARRLELFLYRRAYRIAAVTEGISEAISADVGPAKVMFLPNGVDTVVFRPGAGDGSGLLNPGEIGFVYAGTHGYGQGLDVILDAAELLHDLPKIVFLLVGDGPEKPRLQKKGARLANVRFCDPRPASDMPALLAEARASIVPLRNVPLFRGARPSKIFPSLACGTPVIYSGAGEAATLIEGNHCGVVVPPEHPAELAAAVQRLASDRAVAEEMGDNGRRLVERDYRWTTIADQWLAALPARGVEEHEGAAT